MAYIPIKAVQASTVKSRLYNLGELSGGLCIKESHEKSRFLPDNKLSRLCNLSFCDGELVTRNGISRIAKLDGRLHSITKGGFFGKKLFHIGGSVYSFDGNATTEIFQNVGDCESIFVKISGKAFLLTEQGKIIEVDKDFNCVEKSPFVPNIAIYSSNIEYESADMPINMMTSRVKCTYKGISSPMLIYSVPFEVDSEKPIVVYINGQASQQLRASRTDTRKIIINGNAQNLAENDLLTIEYSIKNSEESSVDSNFSKIFGCKMWASFGGAANGGTRLFLSGNKAYPGFYFVSELNDATYFPENKAELLGDGTENITGMEKRYEKLFFFLETRIFYMTYSFQEAQGASFSVSEISTTVGCTMPDTLQLIDNTLVFGDKSRGIFILQSTDIFDELNVKQLSANIKCEGKPFANGDSFFSCDHDRKYYVFDGKTLYCWDYGRTPYYTSGDHEKAQERLAWFAYEGFEGAVCAFTLEGELYFGFEKNGFSICLFDKNAEFDSVDGKSAPISACLRTKSYDFERYNTPKTAQYICLDYHASAPLASKIEISVFGDGKKFFSAKPRLSKQTARLKLKLPPYCATSFGIEICTASGGVGFSNLSVCVRDSVRKKYTV